MKRRVSALLRPTPGCDAITTAAAAWLGARLPLAQALHEYATPRGLALPSDQSRETSNSTT